MTRTLEEDRTERGPACRTRNTSIEAALVAVDRSTFPPIDSGRRELAQDAAQRVLEDVALRRGCRVLVVEPISAYLPVVCGHLAARVDVVCRTPWRAGQLAEQLGRTDAPNVHLCTYLAGACEESDLYDVVLLCQYEGRELHPDLICLLAPGGAAAMPIDKNSPPRRVVRVLHTPDGDVVEEELDLTTFRPLLTDLLVDGGALLRQVAVEAVRNGPGTGRALGQELLQRGQVREDDLYRAYAAQDGIPYTDTGRVLGRMDPELVRSLPRKYLDHYRFVPIRRESGKVVVATTNLELPVWELQTVFDGADVVAELISPSDMARVWTAIELGFVDAARAAAAPAQVQVDAAEVVAGEDSRASGLFDAILADAVAERASDIHLEMYDRGARLRFRVDGSLRDVRRYRLEPADVTQLVNVIKLAGSLDIAERRLPQGGRIQRRIGGRRLDLRVQTQPSLHHENVVIRLMPLEQRPPAIEELGFAPDVAATYRRLLQEPNGLVLVVGATGSGKSTTLYAGLQLLAADETRKVITAEDPIEFPVLGVQQTQVHPAIGLTFAGAMRAFVREDPDVIMVGEIRDQETALEAIRAAQTGHLVLSTLHCNDTVDAVQRLVDLGMHPNSIASELSAVLAQRLARRICPHCREESLPDPSLAAELFPNGIPVDFRCYRGRGCTRCDGVGTRGRIAIVELLRCDGELRRAIAKRVDLDELRELARKAGQTSLRDRSLELVRQGVIAMPELYDVLSAEQMRPHA
ncbi:MAG: hypothetical protein RL398_2989 [Planctomycetota bacterium]|jgi:type IV pilus assembly protein PilB